MGTCLYRRRPLAMSLHDSRFDRPAPLLTTCSQYPTKEAGSNHCHDSCILNLAESIETPVHAAGLIGKTSAKFDAWVLWWNPAAGLFSRACFSGVLT